MFNVGTEQRQRKYTHQAATVTISSLILGFQLDQFGWVVDVAFCWVEVVINGSDDVLRGVLELPFRQIGDNL